ncbi:class I SAM-dependent methyltransferase [Phycicoccus sp. CSK15P-2]|uniref:class I SAM-dependent methyltransferase n=1 Tax=Phycicoccus sp. CSK15P-2 TaxID=2807627 RepID=UPI00194DB251|nr:class I SAM-dependent methyltransferase [Phycicoccus sp. CSK15P-2]MBM6405339.1 class I SAM-dependent methyltransferase [Phycicoccus sp. CSK15P-2]
MDATAWDARYSGAEPVWSSTPNVFVAELAGALPPGRALDVAAGEGRNAVWLAERGWDVTMTDFSAVGVERARTVARGRLGEGAEGFRAFVGDALESAPAPVDGGGYDLVVLAYLQLPEQRWRTALARAVDAAVPGGTVVVVCHAERNLTEGVGGPQDAAVLHDPEAVVASAHGLPVDVVSADLRERVVEAADRPALDTVVVLERH